MANGLLSLKWNNHKSTFFHVLSSIRSKESYCDATLACDGRFYPVHKLVLSTCSEYFEQIFDRTQCKHPVIVLKDIRHEELEALMNYMYVGEVNVLQDKLSGLIKAAECLKIKGLAVPDEEPLSFKEIRRNRPRSDLESPCAKRKKRDEPLISEDRIRPNSSQDSRIPHSDQLLEDLSAKATSPLRSTTSESESKIIKENSYCKLTSKSANDTSSSYLHENSAKRLVEPAVKETTVKTEPPDINISEEIDIKDNLHAVFNYDHSDDGNSVAPDENDIRQDGNDSDFSNSVTESTPQNVDETSGQTLPCSSIVQRNSFSLWDGEGSSQNFPSEEFSEENNSNRSLMSISTPMKVIPRPSPQYRQDFQLPCATLSPTGFSSRSLNSSPTSSTGLQLAKLFNCKDPLAMGNHSLENCSSTNPKTPSSQGLTITSVYSTSSQDRHDFLMRFQDDRKYNYSKKFICTVCSKMFRFISELKIHFRIHTGEKPFKCMYCDYKATQKGNLAAHVISHSSYGKFICPMCNMNFAKQSALALHLIECPAIINT